VTARRLSRMLSLRSLAYSTVTRRRARCVCTTDYPFDVQKLRIRFKVEGANLFTCNMADAIDHNLAVVRPLFPLNQTSEGEDKLLPFTREWLLAGFPKQAITLEHPVVDGNTRYDMCAPKPASCRKYAFLRCANWWHVRRGAGATCRLLLSATRNPF
jgi:hypothetical protein